MPSLHELQRDFARALTDGPPSALVERIVARELAAEDRIGIYRNNVRENFIAALTAGFPVLERLGGEAWFRQMAGAYQRRHPSRSGNLFYTGERLAAFLAEELDATEYEYFADVARLEWLCQEAAIAPPAGALPIERLARIDAADYGRLRLHLNPAVRLMESRYPVLRIWEQNQPDRDASETIDLASGGDRLLIRVGGSETRLQRLGAGDFAFLSALERMLRLDQSAAAATAVEPEFPLPERLREWVSRRVIIDFSLQLENET